MLLVHELFVTGSQDKDLVLKHKSTYTTIYTHHLKELRHVCNKTFSVKKDVCLFLAQAPYLGELNSTGSTFNCILFKIR